MQGATSLVMSESRLWFSLKLEYSPFMARPDFCGYLHATPVCVGGGLWKPRPLLLHICFTSFVGVKELVTLVGRLGSSCWKWRDALLLLLQRDRRSLLRGERRGGTKWRSLKGNSLVEKEELSRE